MKRNEFSPASGAPERYGDQSPPRDSAPPVHHSDSAPPDRSHTEGRMGTGKNTGVRSAIGGTERPDAARINASDVSGRNGSDSSDPDLRVGAKGIMHQDIGESICRQPGNDCAS